MSAKLPVALPGIFSPTDLAHLPLPTLLTAGPNDLLAYVKNQGATLAALSQPDDAVVARMAALINQSEDYGLVLDPDSANRSFQMELSPSSASSKDTKNGKNVELKTLMTKLSQHKGISRRLEMFDVESAPGESLMGPPEFLAPRLHQTIEDEEEEDVEDDAENVTNDTKASQTIDHDGGEAPAEVLELSDAISDHSKEPEEDEMDVDDQSPAPALELNSSLSLKDKDPLRGVKNGIKRLREWKLNMESKALAAAVPEELLMNLVLEINLCANRCDKPTVDDVDSEFVMDLIVQQVRMGRKEVDSVPPFNPSSVKPLPSSTINIIFSSLEASLLAFTMSGYLELSGQEDSIDAVLEFAKKLQRLVLFPRFDSMYQEVSGTFVAGGTKTRTRSRKRATRERNDEADEENEEEDEEDDDCADSDEDSSDRSTSEPSSASINPRRSKIKKQSPEPAKPASRPRPAKRTARALFTAPPVQNNSDEDLQRMMLKLADIFRSMSAVLTSGLHYPDTLALSCSICCMEAFYVENIIPLQEACSRVLACIFRCYPGLRTSVIDDIVMGWPKVLRNGRATRSIRITGERDSANINIYTMMIMEILQAGASSHLASSNISFADEASDSDSESGGHQNRQARPKASFMSARKSGGTLIESLVSKCFAGTSLDSDFRTLLESIVEDLLACMFNCEWPAAELLVQLCTKQLVVVLSDGNAPNDFRQITVTHLGAILAHVRKFQLSLTKSSQSLFAAPVKQSIGFDDPKTICPVCSEPWQGNFMLDCDECHRWFHGACVNVSERSAAFGSRALSSSAVLEDSGRGRHHADGWKCDPCIVVEQIRAIRARYNAAVATKKPKGKAAAKSAGAAIYNSNADIEGLVTKQLILNHLANKSKTFPHASDARQFLLTQWRLENTSDAQAALLNAQWALNDNMITAESRINISSQSVGLLFAKLVLKHQIWHDFMRPVTHVLSRLNEKDSKMRRQVMVAIKRILEADPSIMGEQLVFQAIRARFLDSSILVRESALDIVGDFMLSSKQVAVQYYPVIASQLNDVGLSVRKRVIKILKALILHPVCGQTVPLIEICSRFASCGRDNPTVQNMAQSILIDIWLKGCLEPDAKSNSADSEPLVLTIETRVNLMLDVLSSFTSSAAADLTPARWFVDLLRLALGFAKDGSETESATAAQQKKSNTMRSLVQKVSEVIVSSLLQLDYTEKPKSSLTSRKIASFAALHMFAIVEPNLLVPLIEQMAPLLKTKDVSPEWSVCLLHLCPTIELVLPRVSDAALIIPSVESDLITIAKHFSTPVVQASLKTMCSIIQTTHADTGNIERLYQDYLFQLQADLKILQQPTPSRKERLTVLESVDADRRRVMRCMLSLSCLCRYYAWPDLPKILTPPRADLEWMMNLRYGATVEDVFDLFMKFWKHSKGTELHAMTIKSIGFLFATYPGILLRSTEKVLVPSLEPTVDEKLKIQVIQSLIEFLDEEDSRAAKAAKDAAKETENGDVNSVAKISIADSSVSSTIPQYFLGPVCDDLTLSSSEKVRFIALGLLKRLLKRGLVLPTRIVPPLMAAQLDQNTLISTEAFALLSSIPADLQQIGFNASKAISEAIDFMLRTYKSCRPVITTNKVGAAADGSAVPLRESALGKIYSLVRENNKQQRTNFISALFKLVERAFTEKPTDLGFKSFVMADFVLHAVAALQFLKEDEVLFVITRLNNIISSHRVGEAFDALKATLSDASAHPKLLHQMRLCVIGIRILQLKEFLKQFYHVTPAKLTAFTGSEAQARIGPCGNRTSIQLVDFAEKFAIPEVPFNWDTLKGAQLLSSAKSIAKALKSYMSNDVDDYADHVVMPRATRKRKAPAPKDPATEDATTGTKKAKKPSKKKRKTKDESFSDEDSFDGMDLDES